MSENPPIKNTAGEGFSVEELAIASLAAHLLAGIPWAGAGEAAVLSVECQTRQDGWFFDDAVVQVEKDGIRRAYGCSIKSFALFGPLGAPRDLSVALWQQWRAGASSPFQPDRDALILMTAHHTPEIREAWIGLTESARAIAPETYAARHRNGAEPSGLRREAFHSLQVGTPDQIEATAEETSRMLRSLYVSEHDFQHASSRSATHAIGLCQLALADSARERAPELWNAIIDCVAPIRRKGGNVNLNILLGALAHRFPLKHHPSYAADWNVVQTESKRRMDSLPATVGGTIALDRAQLAQAIREQVEAQRCATLVGDSGNGKSVLARNWAREGTGTVVWLRAADLGTAGGLRAAFGLDHDLAVLVAQSSQPGRIVLDGLDKCSDEAAFDEAARILAALAHEAAAGRWLTLITCCPEDWDRVRRKLLQRSFALSGRSIRIDRFTPAELHEACARLPLLTSLAQRPHLIPMLCWPKALDLVATYGRADDSNPQWTTESDFARWFWQTAICHDEQVSLRDRVARKLAVHLGDSTLSAAPLALFDQGDAGIVATLAREGLIEIDRTRQTARFLHDLVADWARLRELQIQSGSVGAFLQQRLHSPLWHRAVRYYALDLLEQNGDANAWMALFNQFSLKSTADALAHNLMLEGPVFATQQSIILNRLWPVLAAAEGVLLRRFLRQFLQVGTLPDDHFLQQARKEEPEMLMEIAARYRMPWAPYWFGVIDFLSAHTDQVIALAREEIADLCLLWLPLQRAFARGMAPVAAIAVASAREFYRSRLRERHQSRNETSPEEKVCQALLLAAPLMPVEVAELALKLSGRRAAAPDEVLPEEEFPRSRFMPDPGPPQPWPEGPLVEPSPAFRSALMNGQYAAALCRALPEVAAESLLGVLLNIPHANAQFDDFHMDIDEHGFSRGSDGLRSAFWTNGPFVAFLNCHPEIALRTIIQLANFATDRGWELREDLRNRIAVPVTVDGETREWRGTQWSFLWHKGHVFGPKAVCCALLSLEFWFYQQMDANKPVEPFFRTVLQQGRSIALAAVLICVGKKKPELFLGPLRPLVAAVDLHWVERGLRLRGEDTYMAATFDTVGAERHLLQKWVSMPHREELLCDLTLRLYLSSRLWREMFTSEILPRWQARLDRGTAEQPAPELLASTIARFNLANWQREERDGQVQIIYTPPAGLPQPTAQEHAGMERTKLLLFLPMECRKILHGEAECPEAKMVEWWALVDQIKAMDIPDDQDGLRNREDALLGIVSVALVRHRAWLAAMPEREAEARQLLIGTGSSQPKRFWFTEDDICDYKWDNFAAWGIATLWCEEPDNPTLHQAVGALAMWDRYLVVERVMLIAGEHRLKLGARFDQLLAHAVRYAPLRHRVQLDRHEQQKDPDLRKLMVGHLDTYVAGRTKPLPTDWACLAEPTRRRGRRSTRGIDINQLVVALSWAKDLDQAHDQKERNHWIQLHGAALRCALVRIERLAASKDDEESGNPMRDRSPFKDEERLLERVARIVARLPVGANHKAIWEPIYALGTPGDRWIERFNSTWFIIAAGGEKVLPAFAEQWAAMLDYGMTSPAWQVRGLSPASHGDLIKDLLGMRMLGGSFWRAELQPALEAVRAHHEKWAHDHVSNQWSAQDYLHFLSYRAAQNLRVTGLLILHQEVPINDDYFWGDDNTANAFARLLRILLADNFEELAKEGRAREAFLAFALKLTALQHPLGNELLTAAGNRFAGRA
jgi:hypothetical protein